MKAERSEKEITYFRQEKPYACSAAVTRMLLSTKGVSKTEEEILNDMGVNLKDGASPDRVKGYLEKHGFKANYYWMSDGKELLKMFYYLKPGHWFVAFLNSKVYDQKTPSLGNTFWDNEKFILHYVLVTDIDSGFVYIHDPHEEIGVNKLPVKVFIEACSRNLPWKYVFLAVKK